MANPYEAPTESKATDDVRESESYSAVPRRSGCRHFMLSSFTVAAVCLLQYIALDYYVVRVRPYPEETHDFDWTMLFFPVLPTMLMIAAALTRSLRMDTGVLIGSLLLGFVLALPLIATIGVWFHFAIGGTL